MNHKILFVLLLVLSFSKTTIAQNLKKPELELHDTGIKVAYMGSVIYPGLKVGVERPYKHIEKIKNNGKTIEKDRLLSYNLGFYNHKTFHSNLYVLIERTRRRTARSGFFVETSPGIGVSRTFLDGTAYSVSSTGEVAEKSAAGYTYAMLSLAAGIGYDFSKKSNSRPYAMYLKPSILVMAPFNSFAYIRPTVELGVIYRPKNFWSKFVKNIQK